MLSQRERGPPQVVIVGAGFGGLEAARSLRNAPVEVAVVDKHNHHCFQPLLYQVATASLSPADIAWPIRGILRGQANVRVVMAEATGVDHANRQLQTDSGAIAYDYLVIATGATHSYFGHGDWSRFAPGLKELQDATHIRRRILCAFERAEIEPDARERERLLSFIVVGGGPTGVELVGAMAEVAYNSLRYDFRCADPRTARFILIEAGARILLTYPTELSEYAQRTLESIGVRVLTNAPVTEVDDRGVTAGGMRLDAATVAWAAGVRASPAGKWLAAPTDRSGRVRVNATLEVPSRPHVFVIGDAATIEGLDPPVPGIAPAAKQMGRYVGERIAHLARGEPAEAPFRYRHYGDLTTIGRKRAIVVTDHLKLKGFIGWVFWSVAHIFFLIGARNRLVVAFNWLWDYVTLQRGARLIIGGDAAASDDARRADDKVAPRSAVARNGARVHQAGGCLEGGNTPDTGRKRAG